MDRENKHGLAVIVLAVWGVVLLGAFLSDRGGDIGHLRSLISNTGGGPVLGFDGFRDSCLGALIALVIGISWFGLGSLAVSFIQSPDKPERSRLLAIVLRTAAGAAIWSCIWFFLGVAGLYSKPVAFVALLAGVGLAVLAFFQATKPEYDGAVQPEKMPALDKTLIALLVLPLLITFVAALAPPTAKDSLLYHFAVPKAFVAQGGSAFIEGNIASYLALGTEMHTVWAMLLGETISPRAGETAGSVTMFLFFPLLLAAVFGWLRETGISNRSALVAVLIVASVPTAFHVASSGYIDLALALFVTLAIYSIARWWADQQTSRLILGAIFLGAALSIKLTALFVFAAFGLIVLMRARLAKDGSGNMGRILAGGFGALILAGAIASPWYLRTWKTTGSPVFPFYMSIWKGEATGWDVERSNLFQAMNTQYGGADKTAVNYVTAPWRLSVNAQPEQPEYFDGVLGVAFLFGLPLLVWGLWKFELPVEAKVGSAVAAIMFLFWLFSSQQLRYLLPIVPVLSIVIAISVEAVSKEAGRVRTVWQGFSVVAAAVAMLVGIAWFFQKGPVRAALGGETRDKYLTRNLDYYPYYGIVNVDTAPDTRVWLINMRRDTYNIERPVFSDYLFEDWTLRRLVWSSRTTEELKAKAAAMGVNYVLTRHDFLFDFDRSTLVDDKKTRAENEGKLKMARDFILDPANVIRSDSKFSLIKVF